MEIVELPVCERATHPSSNEDGSACLPVYRECSAVDAVTAEKYQCSIQIAGCQDYSVESPETWHPTTPADLALPSKAPQSFKHAEANRLAVFRARYRDSHCADPRKCYVNPRAVDAYAADITISRAVNRADRLDDSVRRSRAPTTPEPISSSWYVAKFAENRRMVRPTRTCYFCLSAVTTPGRDAVCWLVVTTLSCAMGAAKYRLVHLDAVPEYATAAMGALRSQGLYRAFKTVECCGAISACHSEGSIVLIATGFTFSHEILLLFYCLAYPSWSASL